MGKNLIQQARGKGGPTYRSPSFRYAGAAKYLPVASEQLSGTIVDIVHCAGHSAPLFSVALSSGQGMLTVACEGKKVGDVISLGSSIDSPVSDGDIRALANIADGTLIYNIESAPGDGGKFVRSSGTFAQVLSHQNDRVIVMLPSKKQREFLGTCRASIGVLAGGGRLEKPFLKAGNKFFAKKAKNKLWPNVNAAAMNAVDHPYGNKRTSRKSKARPTSRNAPPGRKVGMIAARRTGRRKK